MSKVRDISKSYFLASVLLGGNPSEEVDDYDNYYYNRKTIY